MLQSWLFRIKLNLRLVNPCIHSHQVVNIQQQYKYLDKTIQKTTLISREQLNKNTFLLRFSLTDGTKCLGTQIGQSITLNDATFDKEMTRYYSPISRIDDLGIFDILVNVVHAEKSFSQHLTQLKIGTELAINGPYTSFIYHGYGRLQKDDLIRQYRYIGLIAESTGIAGFFQLIEGIATNGDNTHIGLLYVADTLEELVLLEELVWYAEEKKIQVSFLLRNEGELVKPYWPGLKGELTVGHLEHHLPRAGEDTAVMICGRSDFKRSTKTLLEGLQYRNIYII